jgi:hypothetical protein
MTNISEIVQSAQDGAVIDNLADRFGLSQEQTKSAVYALIPALSAALQRVAANPERLGSVIESMSAETHYHAAFDNPDAAHSDAAIEHGRAALEQLFGSPAAAGQVAQLAARESGIRPDIINQLAPVLASIVLGGLFKSFKEQGLGQILEQIVAGGGLGAVLDQARRREPAAPQPAAPAGGGLGAALGGLLAAIFGSRANSGAPAAPASDKGEGLDAETLDAAI